MKNAILVTGASGVGKTTLCKKLQELGYESHDIDDYPGLFTAFDKRTKLPMVGQDNTDIEKVKALDWRCNVEKLKDILAQQSSEFAFYCGSATNINEIIPLFQKVILLTINSEIMKHRLATRVDNDFGKTSEVQDWILTWQGEWDKEIALEATAVIDAGRELDVVVREVIDGAIRD